MSEALRTLEKAFLIQLIYPQTGVTLPLLPDLKKNQDCRFWIRVL